MTQLQALYLVDSEQKIPDAITEIFLKNYITITRLTSVSDLFVSLATDPLPTQVGVIFHHDDISEGDLSAAINTAHVLATHNACAEFPVMHFGVAFNSLTPPSVLTQIYSESDITVVFHSNQSESQLKSAARCFLNCEKHMPRLTKPKAKSKTSQDHHDIVLTPRQSQILHLVKTRGASNKVIARCLGISESTVKLHMGHILKKYGVRNRTQLALFSGNTASNSTTTHPV